MAWLPSTISKNLHRSCCLICNGEVHESSNTQIGDKVEVIKVICYLLQVNWQVLSHWSGGKYPLCHTCSNIVTDLASIWNELQLVETQLRHKVNQIQVIVEGQYGSELTVRNRRPKSSSIPNPLQMRFIEESRTDKLMRKQLMQHHGIIRVEPSIVQLHLNLGRPSSRRKRTSGSNSSKIRTKRSRTLNDTRATILPQRDNEHKSVESDYEDMKYENSNSGDGEGEDIYEGHGSPLLDYRSSDTDKGDSDLDLKYSQSEDSDDGGSKGQTIVIDGIPLTGRSSHGVMRRRWTHDKNADGRVYFHGIEIIKKVALGDQEIEIFRYFLECGSCAKQIGQPHKRDSAHKSSYCEMKMHIAAKHLGMARCEPCQKDFCSLKALKTHLTSSLHYRKDPNARMKVQPNLGTKGVTVGEDGRMFYNGIEIIKTEVEEGEGFNLNCSRCDKIIFWDKAKNRRRDPYSLMIQHVKVVHRGLYSCRICDKKYTDPRNLESHFRYHHTLKPAQFECKICGKALRHALSLRKHLWTHKSQEDKEASIAAGERPPPTYKGYIEQRREKLGNADMFQCAECGKTFEFKWALHRHEKTHDPKGYECALCGIVFPTPQQRMQHAGDVHNSKKSGRHYYCKFCPEVFKNRTTHQKHEDQHNAKMPYSCENCAAGFALQRSLNNHLKKCSSSKELEGTCEDPKNLETTAERNLKIMSHDGTINSEIVESHDAVVDQVASFVEI